VEISIPELKIRQSFTSNRNGVSEGMLTAKNLTLWSPDNPKLYDVELKLGASILKDQIGFRTIETQGKKNPP
jgi:beta-glucuronidase